MSLLATPQNDEGLWVLSCASHLRAGCRERVVRAYLEKFPYSLGEETRCSPRPSSTPARANSDARSVYTVVEREVISARAGESPKVSSRTWTTVTSAPASIALREALADLDQAVRGERAGVCRRPAVLEAAHVRGAALVSAPARRSKCARRYRCSARAASRPNARAIAAPRIARGSIPSTSAGAYAASGLGT